jgi:hypothetical protein
VDEHHGDRSEYERFAIPFTFKPHPPNSSPWPPSLPRIA